MRMAGRALAQACTVAVRYRRCGAGFRHQDRTTLLLVLFSSSSSSSSLVWLRRGHCSGACGTRLHHAAAPPPAAPASAYVFHVGVAMGTAMASLEVLYRRRHRQQAIAAAAAAAIAAARGRRWRSRGGAAELHATSSGLRRTAPTWRRTVSRHAARVRRARPRSSGPPDLLGPTSSVTVEGDNYLLPQQTTRFLLRAAADAAAAVAKKAAAAAAKAKGLRTDERATLATAWRRSRQQRRCSGAAAAAQVSRGVLQVAALPAVPESCRYLLIHVMREHGERM